MERIRSLYIHLPWCRRKCPYCDFNSYPAPNLPEERQREYTAALLRNLRALLDLHPGGDFRTVFAGGGTPSLFSPGILEDLLTGIDRMAGIAADAEITLEVNPGTAGPDEFRGFRRFASRLSFGIQSLDDRFLRALGRIHCAREAREAVDSARMAGFDNINADMMYGLPGQEIGDVLEDLKQITALGLPHLSWYELTLEEGTPFGTNPPPGIPSEDTRAAMAEEGVRLLADRGYRRYEISNFCQGSHECRHNLNYWEFGDYYGIGAGAHSKITLEDERQILRIPQEEEPRKYLRCLNFTALGERVDPDYLMFQYFLNRARIRNVTIRQEDILRKTFLPPETVNRGIRDLTGKGYLEVAPEGGHRVTEQGWRFGSALLRELLPD